MTGIARALLFVAVLALLPGGVAAAWAQTMERREAPGGEAAPRPGLFQDKCGACHDRADPLVRERLIVAGGILVGAASGEDLRDFMRGHFGAPDKAEIQAIYGALARIARGRGRFHVRCGICHASAEGLARKSLILRDGALFGRYSGREIAEFLLRHGAESAEEAAFFASVLSRQLTDRP